MIKDRQCNVLGGNVKRLLIFLPSLMPECESNYDTAHCYDGEFLVGSSFCSQGVISLIVIAPRLSSP
jgi:hypothetical protein